MTGVIPLGAREVTDGAEGVDTVGVGSDGGLEAKGLRRSASAAAGVETVGVGSDGVETVGVDTVGVEIVGVGTLTLGTDTEGTVSGGTRVRVNANQQRQPETHQDRAKT